MTKKLVKIVMTCAIFFAVALPSSAREVLFLGVTNMRGESAHKHIEDAIRHDLTVNPRVQLVGQLETQRIVREIERLNRTRTERFLPPNSNIADSTIVVRALVDITETLGRQWLLWGKITMRMTVRFYFYEVNGPANYDGEFSAEASMRKGVLLFAKPKKTVHVSAPDRLKLTQQIQTDVIKSFSEFVTFFFNSINKQPEEEPVSPLDTLPETVPADSLVEDTAEGVPPPDDEAAE